VHAGLSTDDRRALFQLGKRPSPNSSRVKYNQIVDTLKLATQLFGEYMTS
jgi:hypothetical protein